MAKRRNSRADILADIERVRIEKGEARKEAQRLEATGAEARVCEEAGADGKKRVVVRARRVDVFQILLEKRALSQDSFNAVRDYEHDVSVALGHTTPERRPDYIRASQEGAPGQSISQAQIEASARVAWVESRLPPRDLRLLDALIATTAIQGQWRMTVEAITLERRDEAQTAAVRLMADNLRDIRAAPRKRAA